jgi:hypothetical protein
MPPATAKINNAGSAVLVIIISLHWCPSTGYRLHYPQVVPPLRLRNVQPGGQVPHFFL